MSTHPNYLQRAAAAASAMVRIAATGEPEHGAGQDTGADEYRVIERKTAMGHDVYGIWTEGRCVDTLWTLSGARYATRELNAGRAAIQASARTGNRVQTLDIQTPPNSRRTPHQTPKWRGYPDPPAAQNSASQVPEPAPFS